jgi:hypothetical protein
VQAIGFSQAQFIDQPALRREQRSITTATLPSSPIDDGESTVLKVSVNRPTYIPALRLAKKTGKWTVGHYIMLARTSR